MTAHMKAYIANEAATFTSFGKGQSFQDKHVRYPIPLSAIDLRR